MPDIYGTLTLINTVNKAHKDAKRTGRKIMKTLIKVLKVAAIVVIVGIFISVLVATEIFIVKWCNSLRNPQETDFYIVTGLKETLQDGAEDVANFIAEFFKGIGK